MWTKRRVRTRELLGVVALAIVMTAGAAWADVTTERPGSILMLPKIVADGTRDTLIEVSNATNSLVTAHCFYINGAPVNPELPPGPTNPPLWQETDFFLFLTRQQPTQWMASAGRDVNPSDPFGEEEAGFDPGLIPPVVDGFQGELVCVQVDASGAPLGGNALTGSASLLGPGGDSSKYNAIAVLGIDVGRDPTLNLDGSEYDSCPTSLGFTHFSQGTTDPVLDVNFPGSVVTNRLALVPCTHDFENQVPANVSVSIDTVNEFEEHTSANVNFTCRLDVDLDDPQVFGMVSPFGGDSTWRYTRLDVNPVCRGGRNNGGICSSEAQCPNGTCDGVVGLVGVLESAHVRSDGPIARSAQNLHVLASSPADSPGAQIELVCADTDGCNQPK